jgi:hypothetical protein
MQTFSESYTVRPVDEAPAIEWRAEAFFNGRKWSVDLSRNGHPYANGISPSDVIGAIKIQGGRDAKIASRIAKKLLGPIG